MVSARGAMTMVCPLEISRTSPVGFVSSSSTTVDKMAAVPVRRRGSARATRRIVKGNLYSAGASSAPKPKAPPRRQIQTRTNVTCYEEATESGLVKIQTMEILSRPTIQISTNVLVGLTALTHGLFGLTMNMTGVTMEALAQTAQTSVQNVGVCVSFTGLGNLVGIVCAHRLSRICESPFCLLALAMMLQALALSLVPCANNMSTLSCVHGLIGASGCILSFTVHDMLSKRLGHKRAGSAINLVNAAFGIGAIVAPIFAAFCARLSNILLSFNLLAMFAMSGSAVWALLYFVDDKTGDPVSPSAAAHKTANPNWSIVVPIAILLSLSVGAERVFSTWFFFFVSSISLAEAGLAVSLFWSCFAIGRFLAVPASQVFKPLEILSRTIPIALLGSTAALLGASASWTIASAAIGCGLGLSCTFANGMSYLSGHQQLTHVSQGVVGVGTGLSGALFPTSVSILSCISSIQVAFPVVLVGLVLVQVLLVAHLRQRQAVVSYAF